MPQHAAGPQNAAGTQLSIVVAAEDLPGTAELCYVLRGRGHTVTAVTGGDDFVRTVAGLRPDVVLTDDVVRFGHPSADRIPAMVDAAVVQVGPSFDPAILSGRQRRAVWQFARLSRHPLDIAVAVECVESAGLARYPHADLVRHQLRSWESVRSDVELLLSRYLVAEALFDLAQDVGSSAGIAPWAMPRVRSDVGGAVRHIAGRLKSRHVQVWRLSLLGRDVEQISRALGISAESVWRDLAAVRREFGAPSDEMLAALVMQAAPDMLGSRLVQLEAPELTRRDVQVLRTAAGCGSRRELVLRLGLSRRQVSNLISALLPRMECGTGVPCRTLTGAVARYALLHRKGRPPVVAPTSADLAVVRERTHAAMAALRATPADAPISLSARHVQSVGRFLDMLTERQRLILDDHLVRGMTRSEFCRRHGLSRAVVTHEVRALYAMTGARHPVGVVALVTAALPGVVRDVVGPESSPPKPLPRYGDRLLAEVARGRTDRAELARLFGWSREQLPVRVRHICHRLEVPGLATAVARYGDGRRITVQATAVSADVVVLPSRVSPPARRGPVQQVRSRAVG